VTPNGKCPNCGRQLSALFTSVFCPWAERGKQFCMALLVRINSKRWRVQRVAEKEDFPIDASHGWYLTGTSPEEDPLADTAVLVARLQRRWAMEYSDIPANKGDSMRRATSDKECQRLAFFPVD
jgi:hypothetical protein